MVNAASSIPEHSVMRRRRKSKPSECVVEGFDVKLGRGVVAEGRTV